MPSGAKKRKAAKKKKELQANTNTNSSSSLDNSSPRGNEDPKSQDERESDGGEVGSPLSQDHHNEQNPFNEENEESEKTNLSSVASECKPIEGVIEDSEGSQKLGVRDDTAVIVERELNPEQYTESKDINVGHVESAKKVHDGYDKSSSSSSSTSSTSSSSDDEPQAFDKKRKEDALNSASGNVENTEEVTQVLGIEKPLKESNGNQITETVPTVDLVTHVVPISDMLKHVMEHVEVESSKVLDVVESGLKENEKQLLQESSDVVSSLVSEENKDNLFLVMNDENTGASINIVSSTFSGTSIYAENIKDSGTVNGSVVGNEAKTSTASATHASETSNYADKAKYTETSEYIETRPLLPSAPQVSQRTSWMSCCGLFDVFTGSSR